MKFDALLEAWWINQCSLFDNVSKTANSWKIAPRLGENSIFRICKLCSNWIVGGFQVLMLDRCLIVFKLFVVAFLLQVSIELAINFVMYFLGCGGQNLGRGVDILGLGFQDWSHGWECVEMVWASPTAVSWRSGRKQVRWRQLHVELFQLAWIRGSSKVDNVTSSSFSLV